MKRSRFSEEQVIAVQKEEESGIGLKVVVSFRYCYCGTSKINAASGWTIIAGQSNEGVVRWSPYRRCWGSYGPDNGLQATARTHACCLRHESLRVSRCYEVHLLSLRR